MVHAVLLAIATSIQPASDVTADRLGFGYCPPPIVPRCIDAAPPRHDPAALDACSRDVLRLAQALGAYRACLTRESERAIGDGNAAIARFRCMASGGKPCASPRLAPATER